MVAANRVIEIPEESAKKLEIQAQALGMTLSQYIEHVLVTGPRARSNPAAVSAAERVMTVHAESMRKLAQ